MSDFKLLVLKIALRKHFSQMSPISKMHRDALRATQTMGSTEKQAPGGCE